VSGFVLQRWFSKKEKMLDGVLEGHCRGMENFEYLQCTAEEMEVVMCD
jgi:hypothetical protein